MSHPGRIGVALGTAIVSNEWQKRQRKRRKRQEQRWAAKSGPVTVRFVDPATLRKDAVQTSESTPEPPRAAAT